MQLDGRVAVITGGSRGLGWAIAQAYAREGAQVTAASRSASLPAHAPDAHGSIVPAHVDVSNPDSVEALLTDTAHRHGRLDVVVANAGINVDGKVADLPTTAWADLLATNLTGTFLTLQQAAKYMRARGSGRIITVSSCMATRPAIGTAAYAASKAGIEALTRVAALELGKHGILVNCIAPGLLDDGMGRQVLLNSRLATVYQQRLALGRVGQVAEAARVAVFLAADASSYVNGAVLEVHGGLSWS